METTVITSVADAESIVEEWASLADACDATPFTRPTFALPWWRALGKGELMLVTTRIGGRLVGLAPLHARRVGHVTVVRWLGHGLGSVMHVLVHPAHPEAAAAVWQAAMGRGRVLELVETHENCVLPSEADLPGRHALHVEPRDVCLTMQVTGDCEDMVSVRERKRVRRTLRVSRRRLAVEQSEFGIRVATDVEALGPLMPGLREVFDESERRKPRLHLLAGEWQEFTESVMESCLAAGEMVVFLGEIEGRPAAFDIAFLGQARISSWVGHFHPEFEDASPGHLLQAAEIDWAHEQGVRTIDLLLGDAFYKRLWTDGEYATTTVTAGSRTGLGTLGASMRAREAVGRLRS